MSKTYYFMMGLVLLISIITVIDGTEISGTDLSLGTSNSSGAIDIVLDQVPAGGLAGYQIEINFSKPGVAEFTHVNWPEAFSMNSASSLPSALVNVGGVDLSDQIKPGELNVLLVTLDVKGLSDGVTDMKISIPELTDDSGSPIPATTKVSSIRVGTKQDTQVPPTGQPTASPTTSPTGEPTTVPPTVMPTTSPGEPQVIPTSMPTTVPTTIPTTMPSQEPTKETDEHKGILKAEFSAMPQSGTPPLAVNFTDLSTGHPIKWEWNFGDGTMSRKQNPVHVYGGIGRYTVTLDVSNSNNSSTVRKQELIQVTGDYPKGPAGFVLVTSNPSGAQVFTDNRYLGTTPSTLIVPAGSKALSYKKEGYMNKTVQVDIRPDEIKLVPIVILKPIPQ